MGEITEATARLTAEWKLLQLQWENTRANWLDSVGDRFEREFWSVWEHEVPRFLRAVCELEETLTRAIRNTST